MHCTAQSSTALLLGCPAQHLSLGLFVALQFKFSRARGVSRYNGWTLTTPGHLVLCIPPTGGQERGGEKILVREADEKVHKQERTRP